MASASMVGAGNLKAVEVVGEGEGVALPVRTCRRS